MYIKYIKYVIAQTFQQVSVQFSLFMHSDQAQNTSSGIQGQEATAVAVIYVTAPREEGGRIGGKLPPSMRKSFWFQNKRLTDTFE